MDSFQPQQTATANETILLAPPAPLQVIFPYLYPQANVFYSSHVSASGGVPPYSYWMSGGALAAGLVFNPNGTITGMPQTAGKSTFPVTVTDSYSPQESATASGTMVVEPPPPESGTVTVTATSGGIVNTVTINVSVPAPASANSVQSTRR